MAKAASKPVPKDPVEAEMLVAHEKYGIKYVAKVERLPSELIGTIVEFIDAAGFVASGTVIAADDAKQRVEIAETTYKGRPTGIHSDIPTQDLLGVFAHRNKPAAGLVKVVVPKVAKPGKSREEGKVLEDPRSWSEKGAAYKGGDTISFYGDKLGFITPGTVAEASEDQSRYQVQVGKTVHDVSAPDITCGPFRDSDDFCRFKFLVNELLGKLPTEKVEQIAKSEDFKHFEDAMLDGKDFKSRKDFVKTVDEWLGELPDAVIKEFAKSPDYNIYSKVAARYAGGA